jgi:hypothetical protein
MSIVNRFNSDKWKVSFSNFPIPTTRTTKLDLSLFDNFVKTISLPDFSLEYIQLPFGGYAENHSVNKLNSNLNPLTLEFLVDEDMENYFAFYDWYDEVRKGNASKNNNYIHRSNIAEIMVKFLDNQNRDGAILRFSDCVISSVSSLNLLYGSSDHVPFTVTFLYNKHTLTKSNTIKNN